jgi:hypothetical protein
MVKTSRKHSRKHKKSKRGGSLSGESNRPGMKYFHTKRTHSSNKTRKSLNKQRLETLCLINLKNGINTASKWEQFLNCKRTNQLDDIITQYPTGEAWMTNIHEMTRARKERQTT